MIQKILFLLIVNHIVICLNVYKIANPLRHEYTDIYKQQQQQQKLQQLFHVKQNKIYL